MISILLVIEQLLTGMLAYIFVWLSPGGSYVTSEQPCPTLVTFVTLLLYGETCLMCMDVW